MTHTKQFIEDAVAGGWTVQKHHYAQPIAYKNVRSASEYHAVIETTETVLCEELGTEVPMTVSHQINTVLLDPAAWQAVGKTRGWDKETAFTTLNHDNVLIGEDAAFLKNREFLEHLWDGKTVAEALQAISE